MRPQLSVVIPVCREAAHLDVVVAELRETLDALDRTYEIVVVVDGDLPVRLGEARALAEKQDDIRLYSFERRFGEGAALRAGLTAAHGKILVSYPSYHQVKPDVIGDLIQAIDDGADLAYGARQSQHESWFNRLQRGIFNGLLRLLMGVRLRDLGCAIRAVRAEISDEISIHGGFHRFMAVAAVMRGLKVQDVPAQTHPKARSMRAYSPLTYCKRVLDLANIFFLTRFVYKPLRFFGFIGGVMFVPGFVICAYLSGLKIFVGASLADRPLFLFGVLLVALGLQIVAIGLLAEIITYSQASRTKPYVVHRVEHKKPAHASAPKD